jgi:16S rRNA C967 or C1407 C5-methylase (RsmB/RsmF family)
LGAFQLLHMDRIPARAAIDESVELAKQVGQRFASAMVNAVLRKLSQTHQLLSHPSRTNRGMDGAPGLFAGEAAEKQAAGAKAQPDSVGFMRGMNPPPPSVTSSSAACLALDENAGCPRRLAFGHLGEHGPLETLTPEEIAAHPAWMVERWEKFFGPEATRAICRHGQIQPVQAVRLMDPAAAEELAAAGVTLEAGELLTAARTVVAGDVTATEAFAAGRVRLQDEGSQLVAEIAACCGDLSVESAEKILDACAAPGGKTLILAERHPQAHIVALESSAARLAELEKRLAFLGERVKCQQADAAALTDEAAFDLALADVPCSGTGTLGRNPEIRHRLRLEDFARQAARQQAILAAALRAVRPGGCVVYSTCSLEPEENEQVIAATPSARVVSLEARIEELLSAGILTPSGAERLRGALTPEGYLRLLPGAFHTDGFFIALLRRNV